MLDTDGTAVGSVDMEADCSMMGRHLGRARTSVLRKGISMEINVRTIGEVHSVQMGDFGIELTAEETAELRHVLNGALRSFSTAESGSETEAELQTSRRTEVNEV